MPLGDVLEMLTIVYSSVNFVLYCFMSAKFRRQFTRVLSCRKMGQSHSLDAISAQTTIIKDHEQLMANSVELWNLYGDK